jgi:hypothetical protein
MDSYRLGPLGWSPAQQSYFSSFLSATNMATTAFITTPILARYGNMTVYKGATLVASIAYFLLGQSWRGSSKLQTTAQYTMAKCLLQTPWSEPSRAAIKPMVIKQGISASNGELGRGQISAAYDTIDSLLSAVMPLFWGGTFAFLWRQPKGSFLQRWIGPGGHFVVAAAFRLISWRIIKGADPATLSLEDEDEDASVDKPEAETSEE